MSESIQLHLNRSELSNLFSFHGTMLGGDPRSTAKLGTFEYLWQATNSRIQVSKSAAERGLVGGKSVHRQERRSSSGLLGSPERKLGWLCQGLGEVSRLISQA